jgi:two-component system sensor histidine kinase HydH
VHHDVRNGLIPIRNVLSHLTQVARESPDRTAEVLLERQGTLDSSVAYLQSLASNYARLSPSVDRRECDVNRIVQDVVADTGVAADLAPWLPPVLGDPVALRRVLENLVVNAIESLPQGAEPGNRNVVVATELVRDGGAHPVRLVVADNGRGMSDEERRHMFEDFYTTKAHGTGLGLSIVRRLVNDLGGRIDVVSAPGQGTEVVVELPGAGAERDA